MLPSDNETTLSKPNQVCYLPIVYVRPPALVSDTQNVCVHKPALCSGVSCVGGRTTDGRDIIAICHRLNWCRKMWRTD